MTIRRSHELSPLERSVLLLRCLNDAVPVLRGDIPPIAPLPDSDAAFANVGSKCFCVALPDGVYGGKV